MKKERILYFDVIKFIAIICVFVCHFARTLEYYQISYSFKILPDNIFSIYTGTIGCVLFFIVSGAALTYVYNEQISLKGYFLKRIKGIYPMFWTTFIIFFSLQFYIDGGYNKNIPINRLLYTIIGFDGLIANFCDTFYTIGEWFLGVLIILYFLFPFLNKLIDSFPYATLTVSMLLGVIIDYTYKASKVDILFIEWIPVFVCGMVFTKCIKKVNKFLLVASVVVLVSFTVFDLNFVYKMTSIYFVGIALFFILAYLLRDAGGGYLEAVSSFVGRYCYPIFLVHHRIMLIFIKRFSSYQFSAGDVICLFVFIVLITLGVSYLIDRFTKCIISMWSYGITRGNK